MTTELLEQIKGKIRELNELIDKLEEIMDMSIDEIEPDFAQVLDDLDKYYGYLELALKTRNCES